MTEQQMKDLAAGALSDLTKTSISYPEFLKRKKDPKYDYKHAHWQLAIDALEKIIRDAPPPPPPAPHPLAQFIIITSDDPWGALNSPPHYALALSSDPDPGLGLWRSDAFITTAKQQGRKLYSWGDCDKTLPPKMKADVSTYHLDGWMGQAESNAQFDTAINAGAYLMVLDAGQLSSDRIDRANQLISSGVLSCTQEAYANEGAPWPDVITAAGINVSSLCPALYKGKRGYISLAAHQAHSTRADGTNALAGACWYVSGQENRDDIRILP